MFTLSEFANDALLTPFKEHGRDYDGWDCWGLLYLCHRDVFGIKIPSFADAYGSTSRRDELRKLISGNSQWNDWEQVETPEAGDAVYLAMHGRFCHVGVMLDSRHVLHTEERCGTVVERIDRAPWKGDGYNKIEGFYRHVKRK